MCRRMNTSRWVGVRLPALVPGSPVAGANCVLLPCALSRSTLLRNCTSTVMWLTVCKYCATVTIIILSDHQLILPGYSQPLDVPYPTCTALLPQGAARMLASPSPCTAQQHDASCSGHISTQSQLNREISDNCLRQNA